jgi:ferredoxin-NADP reductase
VSHANEIRVRVDDVQQVAERIRRFRLVPVDSDRLPSFSGGAHVTVLMDDGSRRIRNPYSLNSSPESSDCYEISVLHVEQSRGGSEYMHTRVSPGLGAVDHAAGQPVPGAPAGPQAHPARGGIGITPFMAMTAQLAKLGQPFELHYSMRNDSTGAYGTTLQESYGSAVTVYRTDLGEQLPLDELLEDQPLGTHLYVCGPKA